MRWWKIQQTKSTSSFWGKETCGHCFYSTGVLQLLFFFNHNGNASQSSRKYGAVKKPLALKQTCPLIPTVNQSKMLFLVLCTLGKNTFSLITSHFYWTMTSTPRLPLCLSDKESTCDAGDVGSIPRSGRPSGKGNSNPLQYSCLENPVDRGAWRATVHGAAKSQTQLKWLNVHPVLYLKQEMATHSSILAWKVSWTEEPGWLQSMGLQRVRRDWALSTFYCNEANIFTIFETF